MPIDQSVTLKARAWKTGRPASTIAAAIYTMVVATPTFSPGTGTYTSAQTVSMATTTSGATIRYTTDGSTPTVASPAYTAPISVGTTTTVKAAGFKAGWTQSGVGSATYTMDFGQLSAPTVSPAAGTYTSFVTVTLEALSGSTIRYTTDGSTPTETSATYASPLTFYVATTLKAKAYRVDYSPSAVTTAAYAINVAAPTFSPGAGTYTAGQAITVSSATPDVSITYTTTGADPTVNDPGLPASGTIIAGNFTLKAKAWKTGANPSAVTSGAYVVTGSLTQPRRIAGGGTHSLAVRGDGVPWAFGDNGSKQLGDGSTAGWQLAPVRVSGGNGIVALSGGTNHSVALRSDGAVFAWGANANGQLGDGTTTVRGIPTAVSGLTTGVTAVAAGGAHSVALKSDGTLVAWGLNSSGQLGDGTTTQRTTPVVVTGLTGVTAIAARGDFTLALKSDGSLWAWGRNTEGELGDGTTTQRTSPVQVSALTGVSAIAAGGFHSLAVKNDGTAYAWGLNNVGQLGDGTLIQRTSPVAVSTVTSATAVAAGSHHSLVLKNDGSVQAFGQNGNGQLGDGTTTNRSTAVSVTGLPVIAQIAAGSTHSLAITSDGIVYSWGYNYWGQLGDNTWVDRTRPSAISGPGLAWSVAAPIFNTPSGTYSATFNVVITVPDTSATIRYTTNGVDPTATDPIVTSGGSVAITQSTTLKASAWKTGSPTSLVTTATYVLKAVTPVLSPATGTYGTPQTVTMSTTTSGATIRYTLDGSEPTSSSTAYSSGITVSDTRTVKAVAFKTGWSNSDSGFASYWISAGTVSTPTFSPAAGTYTAPTLVTISTTSSGASIRYTLDGSDPSSSSLLYAYPFVVSATTTIKARAFKSGYTQSAVASGTYAIDASGAVATPTVTPGSGIYVTAQTVTVTGASGATLRYTTTGVDPTTSDTVVTSGATVTIDRAQILKVKAWQTGLNPSAVRRADYVVTGAIAAGGQHSLALKADNTVWGWGMNASGQVGDGTTTNRTVPVQALTGAVAISAGSTHSLAVKTNATAWFWGSDGLTASSTPVLVSGLADVVAVAAGRTHSLALKSNGTVWSWGQNGSGQLGDGTTTNHTTPALVPGLSGISAIAATGDFSMALGSDGANGGVVWTWGANGAGQLGDGSTFTRTLPVSVLNLSSVRAISAGEDWAMALKTDGSVWVWGANAYGQLGNGTTTGSITLIQVLPLTKMVAIEAGTSHALAIARDGRVWAWGRNSSAQLGNINYYQDLHAVPQLVSNLLAPVAVSGGGSHSLAIKADGSVVAFGSGDALGNGTGGVSEVPVSSSGLTVATNTWLNGDADADGLITWREYLFGTDPLNADTNGNGVHDGVDATTAADPNNPDADGDGVPSWIEVQMGTDPFNADSDADTVNDGADAFPLDPTRWDPPAGTPGDTTPPVITLTEPTNAVLLP